LIKTGPTSADIHVGQDPSGTTLAIRHSQSGVLSAKGNLHLARLSSGRILVAGPLMNTGIELRANEPSVELAVPKDWLTRTR
jgi:hypothetical protein